MELAFRPGLEQIEYVRYQKGEKVKEWKVGRRKRKYKIIKREREAQENLAKLLCLLFLWSSVALGTLVNYYQVFLHPQVHSFKISDNTNYISSAII